MHAIADLLTRAGVETDVVDAVQDAIWEKVLVNVGINAATALARVDNGLLADTDPGARLLASAVEEAADVARAEGHAVRDDVVEYVSDVASATGSNRSSMRQDVERGRRTEIERLNGAVVARADDHDVAVPVNRTLTDLVRLTERGYDAA
ncbi:ketopantoate reductase family protein [Halobacteriaceae archaeon GCM10025711]